MSTLSKLTSVVQSLASEHVPPKLQFRFATGIQAFSLQELRSVNANGRLLADKRKTGESRVYRLLRDNRWPGIVLRIILKQFVPRGTTFIHLALDHTQIGPFKVAVITLSVGRGRSLPIWCQVCQDETMAELMGALSLLFDQVVSPGRFILTMDRWFASPNLLPLLESCGVRFICRCKFDLPVMAPWDPYHSVPAGQVSHEELAVEYGGLELRLVRSDYHEGMKQPEPWFLLTNITGREMSRRQILNRYAKRFEIEEFFKDLKWIQRYEWQRLETREVFATLLGFAFLGWWIMASVMSGVVRIARARSLNEHHRLSWFRACYEEFVKLCWPPQLRFVPLQLHESVL
jgi:hypothetical protein